MKKRKSLSSLLMPDAIFDKFDDITPEFLLSKNIKFLLVDIDNTLAPYEQDLPDERTVAYFNSLSEVGITAALVSNNNRKRVELFNSKLSLAAYSDCGKPNKKILLFVMDKMGASIENTAAIGDQLLTDALGAHLVGIPAFIVPPIKDKKSLFFRFKRWLEKPYIKKYHKLYSNVN